MELVPRQKMKTEEFFNQPCLIEDTQIQVDDRVLKVFNKGRMVRFKGLPAQQVAPVQDWLARCSAARAPLLEPGLAATGIDIAVLRALDTAGLVIEKAQPQTARSGIAVLSRIEQRVRGYIEAMPPQDFAIAMERGWTRSQLIGNAFEYYFVTLGAYDALAPAIARLSGACQSIMAEFVIEEYRHDRILLRALEAFDYGEHDLGDIVPLPYTSAVINELFYLSHVDPLAMIACLFVVEGGEESDEGYVRMLERNGAPQAYVDSHREHDRINSNRAHGTISRKCFKHVEHLSEDDEIRITERVLMLYRLGIERQRQIHAYYGNDANPCPRHVSALRARSHAAVH